MHAAEFEAQSAAVSILAQPVAPLSPVAALAGLERGKVALLVAPSGYLAQTEAALILEAARLGPVLIFNGGAPFHAYGLLARASRGHL